MKKSLINSLAAILLLPTTGAMAQQKMMDGMQDMPMDRMMNGMNAMPMGKLAATQSVHLARGKVIKADAGVVTMAHDPVKSLNWPAMTMGFLVKDKVLLDKLAVGKSVQFEFVKGDNGYVITGVK